MLISIFDFRYIYIQYILYTYIIYIYIYIYGNQKTLIPIMIADTTITTIYIYNCNWSFLHVFVVMCYLPKLKRGMASFRFEQISISDLISL